MNGEMIARNIQIILAPAVMITACGILLGVLHGRYQTINDRLRLMTAERLALLRATGTYHTAQIPVATPDATGTTRRHTKPQQSVNISPTNVEDSLAIERISELDAQCPDLLKRHKLAHDATFVVGCGLLVFLCDMFLIASAVILDSVWTATGTLILFLVGAGIVFAGTLLMTLEVRTSHLALHYEVRRVMSLGKKQRT